MLELHLEKDRDQLLVQAKAMLAGWVANGSVLLLCSGGSSLELLDPTWLPEDCSQITLTVLDERFTRDEAVNNFAQIKQTDFYGEFARRGGHEIDTRVRQNEVSPGQMESRMEGEILAWLETHPNGKVVATQGIGADDGHTAGIMPFPEDKEKFRNYFEGEKLVCGYSTEDKNQYSQRVTVTMTFLRNHLQKSLLWIVGGGKRQALQNLTSTRQPIFQQPIQVVYEQQEVHLFTDQEV
jgi:6-phosphogluconolactonase/glucosamine-6-phosphate isomerase/deaminase